MQSQTSFVVAWFVEGDEGEDQVLQIYFAPRPSTVWPFPFLAVDLDPFLSPSHLGQAMYMDTTSPTKRKTNSAPITGNSKT